MKKIILITLVALLSLSLALSGLAASDALQQSDLPYVGISLSSVNEGTISGTLVRENNADPNLFFYNGKYYLTQTGSYRIAVFEADTIEELGALNINSNIEYTADYGSILDPAVEELFGEGAAIDGTWSPEIHYVSEDLFGAEYAGWYMFVGLRKSADDSSMVRLVVLKSTTDSPKGPYGHPVTGELDYSQPVLDADGEIHDEWACGQTLLTIPEGQYKGTYTMWVAEEGRGLSGLTGEFRQKIMIAKMKNPWQLESKVGIVTTPTQEWEYAGSSSTHPRVVEGATPVYGKNGEIFITYSGSGYWSDYGLGQLTWNGGDPLETSSWVKLSEDKNPIFTATTAENLRGAGHASFLTDAEGNGFFCYHAYAYNNGVKVKPRNAYIEPYYIDYSEWNGVSYGVIKLGANGNGVAANTNTAINFETEGTPLAAPEIDVLSGNVIVLELASENAEGYTIYRSEDNVTFEYLATHDAETYIDETAEKYKTYYYRAYAYRNEEISDVSETKSGMVTLAAPTIENIDNNCQAISLNIVCEDPCDSFVIERSNDGVQYSRIGETETGVYTDETVTAGESYYYLVYAVANEYASSNTVSGKVVAEHSEETAPEVENSCTENGYTSYTYCGYCGTHITEPEVIPAAHTEAAIPAVEATCTEKGTTEGTVCSACGVVLVAPAETEALDHDYEKTADRIPATTESEGKTEVYTCTRCGDSYGGDTIPKLEPVGVRGDATGNGKVELLDVIRALRYISNDQIEIKKANADMNNDNEITVIDVILILKALMN